MAHQARINTVVESLTRGPRNVVFPQKNGQVQPVSEVFGQNVFTRTEMAKMLPKPVYKTFIQTLKGKSTIDKVTADAIAHAAKVWSIERGATHFTHWFQPLNDSTAEKHDSFLTLKSSFVDGSEVVSSVDLMPDLTWSNIYMLCASKRLLPLIPSPALNYYNLNLMLHPSLQVVCVVPLRLVVILFGIPRGTSVDMDLWHTSKTNIDIFILLVPCSSKKVLTVLLSSIFLPSSSPTTVKLWMKSPSFWDLPRFWNVSLLRSSMPLNPRIPVSYHKSRERGRGWCELIRFKF